MNIALYAIPMSTIAAGILFSFVQNMCTSNTNLIIRQNDQINFLLQRVIDLNKKINRLQLELNTNTSILLKNLKKELVVLPIIDVPIPIIDVPIPIVDVPIPIIEDEDVEDEEDVDEVFELIETNNHATSNKKTGWLPFFS